MLVAKSCSCDDDDDEDNDDNNNNNNIATSTINEERQQQQQRRQRRLLLSQINLLFHFRLIFSVRCIFPFTLNRNEPSQSAIQPSMSCLPYIRICTVSSSSSPSPLSSSSYGFHLGYYSKCTMYLCMYIYNNIATCARVVP